MNTTKSLFGEEFKRLHSFSTASFAVWPFTPQTEPTRVHADLIIMGLNPSKEISFGTNFHGNRFDVWYEEAFSKAPFAGAYMTDLISIGEPSAAVVVDKWKDQSFRDRHIKSLLQQFEILKTQTKTPIFCIGKNTEALFRSAFPQYTNVFSIGHPNSYRVKNSKEIFLARVAEIGETILAMNNKTTD